MNVTTEPIHDASPTRHRIGDRHHVLAGGQRVGFLHMGPRGGWTVYVRDAGGGYDVATVGVPGSLDEAARITAATAARRAVPPA